MRFLRTAAITTTALAALALSACGGESSGEQSRDNPPGAAATDSASDAAADQVTVKTFMFDPDPVTVERGSRVTWVNQDATPHTVTTGTRTNPDGRVDGQLKASGGKFSTTFDKRGTYKYFCDLHSGPGMTGEVIVR